MSVSGSSGCRAKRTHLPKVDFVSQFAVLWRFRLHIIHDRLLDDLLFLFFWFAFLNLNFFHFLQEVTTGVDNMTVINGKSY